MPERGPSRGATALLAAALAFAPVAATAQSDDAGGTTFGAWQAACITEAAGYCRAGADAAERAPGGGVGFRLRVNLPGFFAEPVVSFVAVDHRLASDTAVAASVDGGAPLRFEPGRGWQAVGAPNDYYLAPGRSAALLASMAGAGHVVLYYRDGEGQPRRQRVELAGLDAALAWLVERRASSLPEFARGTPDGWARGLHALLPAIEACLAVAPTGPAVVTEARAVDRGPILVHLLADGGGRHECLVDGESLAVLEVAPLVAAVAEPGPWYLPASHRPPEDACRGQLMVVNEADRLRGWLLYGC